MPRGCGCAGNSCQCQIIAGPGLNVSGTGNASEPYVIQLSNESGYRALLTTVEGAEIDLTGTVAADIVVHVDAEADFDFRLPTDAPLGTHVEVITVQSFGAVMTVTADAPIRYPGGVVPAFTAVHNQARYTLGSAAGGWVGIAALSLS